MLTVQNVHKFQIIVSNWSIFKPMLESECSIATHKQEWLMGLHEMKSLSNNPLMNV